MAAPPLLPRASAPLPPDPAPIGGGSPGPAFPPFHGALGSPADEPSLGAILASLRRYWLFITLWIVAAMGAGGVMIFSLEPSFRASAMLALATRQIQFSELSAVVSNAANALDTSVARSEVEILNSDGLIRQVVRDLRLDERPDFIPGPSLPDRLKEAVAGLADHVRGALAGLEPLPPPPISAAERFHAAVASYGDRLTVFNDGRSYVITVSFEAADPELAARIANRHAELYIEAQRRSKDQALVSATHWLDREVAELAQRLRRAESAVQAYRERHHLLAPGGTSITQQQLGDINGELAMARADLAQREARLRQAVNAAGGDSFTEVVTSDAIARLREQELIARRRLAEASGSLGDRHPALAAMRAEVRDIRAMIAVQQEKILRSLEGEAEIAREREAELRRIVAELEGRMAQMERDEAGARDLEREANATRALYESLLSRQKQVATQVGIQQPDAQLASLASVPRTPAFPNKPLMLAVTLTMATGSAVGLSLLFDRRRKGLESLHEVEAATGLRRVVAVPGVSRLFGSGMALPDRVVAVPESAAAESLRTLRTTLTLRGESLPRRLAVTSSLTGEGKTSVALALARSLSLSGHRVLLVEGDLRRRSLARLGRDWRPAGGIIGVLEGRTALAEAIIGDRVSTVHILPAEDEVHAPHDLLVPERFGRLLAALATGYDHVIVDTPPVAAVSDALLVGRMVDATLLVVRAATTPRDRVAATVATFHEAGLPLVGAVLNAADPGRSGYAPYGSRPHGLFLPFLRG
ncbi:polysaccharide biosynthesis tyrosine autokinase [Geminicoccaceae bacterium 1502E]|nr:polysaccharide biosynthesis tyrosine autokinase [Geminicoccaceae bacterium 1502E]